MNWIPFDNIIIPCNKRWTSRGQSETNTHLCDGTESVHRVIVSVETRRPRVWRQKRRRFVEIKEGIGDGEGVVPYYQGLRNKNST